MMRPALLLILCASALAACSREPAESGQPALRPDTPRAAEPAPQSEPPAATRQVAPPPEPPFIGCAVMLGSGTAQLFGVCTAETLQAAIAAPVLTPPNARDACTVQIVAGEPVYDGCLDLSSDGLAALTEAARGQ